MQWSLVPATGEVVKSAEAGDTGEIDKQPPAEMADAETADGGDDAPARRRRFGEGVKHPNIFHKSKLSQLPRAFGEAGTNSQSDKWFHVD